MDRLIDILVVKNLHPCVCTIMSEVRFSCSGERVLVAGERVSWSVREVRTLYSVGWSTCWFSFATECTMLSDGEYGPPDGDRSRTNFFSGAQDVIVVVFINKLFRSPPFFHICADLY